MNTVTSEPSCEAILPRNSGLSLMRPRISRASRSVSGGRAISGASTSSPRSLRTTSSMVLSDHTSPVTMICRPPSDSAPGRRNRSARRASAQRPAAGGASSISSTSRVRASMRRSRSGVNREEPSRLLIPSTTMSLMWNSCLTWLCSTTAGLSAGSIFTGSVSVRRLGKAASATRVRANVAAMIFLG